MLGLDCVGLGGHEVLRRVRKVRKVCVDGDEGDLGMGNEGHHSGYNQGSLLFSFKVINKGSVLFLGDVHSIMGT